jgi:alpha-L-rhamnosidase
MPPLELIHHPRFPVAVTRSLGCRDQDVLLASQSVDLGPGGELVLDFGEELVGRPWVRLDAVGAVELSYGEIMEEVDAMESGVDWYCPPRDLCEGVGELAPTGRRAGRWLRVSNVGPKPLTLSSAGWELSHRPTEGPGRFACSDALITQAWEICTRTTRLCMQSFLEDGVKRDGLLWIGDARVQALCCDALYDDHEIVAASLRMIAASQRSDGALPACAAHGGGHQHPHGIDYMPGCPFPHAAEWIILNYCSDFFGMVRDHHMHRGDMALLREMQPCLDRLADFLARTDLENRGGRDRLVDSPGLTHQGAFLGIIAEGALAGCELANWLEDAKLAGTCRALADRARACLANEDPVNLPGRNISGRDIGQWRACWVGWQHAVLAGWLEGEPALARVRELQGDGILTPVAGFARCWQGEALGRCGLVAQMLDAAREWYEPMLAAGATTAWENLDLNPGRTPTHPALLSRCHGWSAGLNHLLPRHVLGLRPAIPGWRRAVWHPDLGGLCWAKGVVATPLGPVSVQMEGQLAEINIPPGMEVDMAGLLIGPGKTSIDLSQVK